QTDAAIEKSEHDRGPHQADARDEKERKQYGREQRAEVVEAEHARDELFEVEMLFQDAHQNRQLETDEHTDHEDDEKKEELKPLQARKPEEEKRGGKAADERDRQLHFDEPRRQIAIEISRQPRSDAESGQVESDDQRELRDGIANHVAGNRSGQQLVNE